MKLARANIEAEQRIIESAAAARAAEQRASDLTRQLQELTKERRFLMEEAEQHAASAAWTELSRAHPELTAGN